MTRSARIEDAPALVPLLDTLGYPATESQIAERLSVLLGRDDAGVVVAEHDGRIVGVTAFQVMELFTSAPPLCRLLALSVSADARRTGVASDLVAAVESEARRRGCGRVEVTSGARDERAGAHAFYERLGYAERPRRYLKALS